MANYEDGRAAYVAAEVAKGVPEDEANYWFDEGDPGLQAAEQAAEHAWLYDAENSDAEYHAHCMEIGA